MKKIYQNPNTDIITISIAQMIAASNGALLGDDPTSEPIDLSAAGETNATSGNLSRRSVWDDEDEEEEY